VKSRRDAGAAVGQCAVKELRAMGSYETQKNRFQYACFLTK